MCKQVTEKPHKGRFWLSRQRNGEYTLSALKPKWRRVGLTNKHDVYITPGDPIGQRGFCYDGVRFIWGVTLQRGWMVRVWGTGGVIGQPMLCPRKEDNARDSETNR